MWNIMLTVQLLLLVFTQYINRIIVRNPMSVITIESFVKVFKLIKMCKYEQVRMHNSKLTWKLDSLEISIFTITIV